MRILITALFFSLVGCASSTNPELFDLEPFIDGPDRLKQVSVTESYEFYHVWVFRKQDMIATLTGYSTAETQGARAIGAAEIGYRLRTNHRMSSNGCAVNEPKVDLEVIFTMPKLVVSSPSVRRIWDEVYYPSLLAHEHHHRDLAIQTADELALALSELAPAEDCDILWSNIQEIFQSHIQKEFERQTNFDSESPHNGGDFLEAVWGP